MLAGEDDISTLARERQTVLEKHLDVAQPSVYEVGTQRRDRALPRVTLTGGWAVSNLDSHLLRQSISKMSLECRQPVDGGAKQVHEGSPSSTK
ncbi:hypothetical protein GCM10011314_33770 [Knoellia flava]|uniref:Uncharacterized protein n=1 Tax=Knoellia flava TaxID=913969 RepID=A0A8H9FWA3_9MICO|nr:hypothetical protein GCM10011314_33770 [Knoellia flava]